MNMPKYTDITEAERVSQVIQVLELLTLDDRMTQKTACKKVGISEAVFRRWLLKNEDAVLLYQSQSQDIERYTLAMILMNQISIMTRLINDAKNPKTFAGDRLQIKRYLDDKQESLLGRMKVIDREIVTDTFSGPPQIHAESTNRLIAENNEDGSVTVKAKPILDAKFLENRYETSIGEDIKPSPTDDLKEG